MDPEGGQNWEAMLGLGLTEWRPEYDPVGLRV